jgi:hypothetical protein
MFLFAGHHQSHQPAKMLKKALSENEIVIGINNGGRRENNGYRKKRESRRKSASAAIWRNVAKYQRRDISSISEYRKKIELWQHLGMNIGLALCG